MKKIFLLSLFSLALILINVAPVDAYVSVKGYYRSNGTYVAPHVRSNPNGLKYDNYSYTPSQGLYNSSYGTRGASWDTPTYITDPYYYEGKALYQSGQSGSTGASAGYTNYSSSYYEPSVYVPSYPSQTAYSTIAGGYKIGDSVICNSGYYKKNNSCISAPANATAYGGDTFYCSLGYTKTDHGCVKQEKENATLVGSTWSCDTGFISFEDRCVNYDTYCRKLYGGSSFYYQPTNSCSSCPDGYQYNQATSNCLTLATIEANKSKILQDQANERLRLRGLSGVYNP